MPYTLVAKHSIVYYCYSGEMSELLKYIGVASGMQYYDIIFYVFMHRPSEFHTVQFNNTRTPAQVNTLKTIGSR